jgi:hypothetical protein
MAQKSSKIRAAAEESTDVGPLSEQIAALAFALWQERGCPDGTAEADWFRAEQEVKAKLDSQSEIVKALSRVRGGRRVKDAVEVS